MKPHILHKLFLILTLVLLVSACSPTTRTSPPDVEDMYWPYRGIDTSFSVKCGENDYLFSYDANAPLDIQEIEHSHSLSITITDLSYASPMGGRVPATLVTPSGDGPYAGLIIQHGMGSGSHPGSRKNNLLEAETYTRLGAVVLLIDAPYNRPEHGIISSMSFTDKDRDEQIQYIIDLRRGVDLLLSLPEVDPHRLAYVGNSGGGGIGGLLAGVEHRLQGYALVVGDGGIVTHVTGPEDYGWWDYKPKELRQQFIDRMWPVEPIHYIGCAAPAALLFQNGTKDSSVPPADALRYQAAGSEPKTVLWYESTHNSMLSDSFTDRADWLRSLIGIGSYHNYLLRVEAALSTWFVLIIISLVVVAWDMRRKHQLPAGAAILWIISTVVLGPFGLLVYWITKSRHQPVDGEYRSTSPGRSALASATWASSGNILGITLLLIGFIVNEPKGFPQVAAMIILIPFFIGWLLFVFAGLISRKNTSFKALYSCPWHAQLASTCLVLLGVVPVYVYLSNQISGHLMGPDFLIISLILSAVLLFAALAGLLTTFPYHYWMIRGGVIRNGADAPEPHKQIPWVYQVAVLLLSLVAVVCMLVLMIRPS